METPSLSQQQLTLNPTPAVPTPIPAATSKTITLQQQQSTDGSSPRAISTTDTEPPLATVPNAKLRLMCSFNGHIMPRPHDKALTYSGGETRMVVVDRRSSLSSLRSRLSSMLLNGRSFTLKYQLPNEDLDSLVTITTDEDLENMLEEYDRVIITSQSNAPRRIRLFLFANKLETAATMGCLLDGAKSDTWFVDALNQSGLLPRGLSDSAAVNNSLVNLDESSCGESENQNVETNVEIKREEGLISHQEMHMSSMPDSPMMEPAGGSSIGSASSSPSTANLPPIRVRVSEEQKIEEQLGQMSFSNVNTTHRQYEDITNRPTMIPVNDPTMIYNNAPSEAIVVTSNGQVSPRDDRSDVSAGYRKPPLPMQPVAVPQRTCGGYGLTSPDSVTSDTSICSGTSFTKPVYYQEQAPLLPRTPVTPTETALGQATHSIPHIETSSAQTTSHLLSQPTIDQQHQPPPPQQPYLQYIPQLSQYVPVYPHQQQNYPVYVMSVPPSPQYVPAGTPPLYPNTKSSPNPRPEAAQNVYHPLNPAQVLQLQQQQQYMGYTANANANYVPQHNANGNYGGGYEYANPPNDAMYYQGQPPPTANTAIPLASPYQTMTPAAAAAALADMSKQMALDGGNQQQQHMASSQPL